VEVVGVGVELELEMELELELRAELVEAFKDGFCILQLVFQWTTVVQHDLEVEWRGSTVMQHDLE